MAPPKQQGENTHKKEKNWWRSRRVHVGTGRCRATAVRRDQAYDGRYTRNQSEKRSVLGQGASVYCLVALPYIKQTHQLG